MADHGNDLFERNENPQRIARRVRASFAFESMRRLLINSFSDNFLTPARSNCQFLCSDDIPKRSPKQKKFHQNDVKNAPVPFPYWLSLYG
jgi:hypothetical protein